ncbi:uncharacterized protein A1O5_02718 [Cladophialophora psammophila CBS 110553]|uniref:BHLH domain-containing protein n=1 Tax=Cladophialophora psammophila CBS 110553 TaxID=1182543 RepID=W9X1T7_9EURO|nr:uncharacterized protein A1O5_02718 [Cladophialophora psammophila CBS 110553]EXJ74422.1 hypothetical protein A1O5_02718 [Cladophialophora psammophila CBS 110553]
MSSHGGQQNFPFGCTAYTSSFLPYSSVPFTGDTFTHVYPLDQPENLHGIGLPEFMTPGPPPGQPLLNAHENRDLDNFFQGFDQNAAANKAFAHTQFSSPADHDHLFDMPPMFVGSDTALAQRSIIDQHQLAGAGFPYGDGFLGHDMNTVSQTTPLVPGMHGVSYSDATFQNPLIAQLQSAASMQPAYTQGWQQSYPPQNAIRIPPQGRLGMDFGTDSRFQPTGYAAPHNPMDPDLPQGLQMNNPIGEWLEPASGSTTQPNTQPNTQPSSPTWSKKRNFDDFVRDQQPRNGFVASAQQTSMAQPSPTQSNPRRKRSEIKIEKRASISQPPTPLSNSKPHSPLNSNNLGIGEQEPDAEAEAEAEREDEEDATEPPRSPSPAPWPASKARPPRNTKAPPPKLPRKKNVSAHTSTPSKPKSKVQRPSVTSTRVPLSLEQKKANHTNSEQRRRDATARAYAELYDLVPELEDMGKQSTMKRLEVVVAKVQRVKQKVEELRAKLGMEPLTGRPISGPSGGSAMLLYSDVPGWPQ